jgi:hypothetical protein
VAAPATEGELYDRLKALAAECDELAGVVDEQTAVWLASAGVHLRGALAHWLNRP